MIKIQRLSTDTFLSYSHTHLVIFGSKATCAPPKICISSSSYSLPMGESHALPLSSSGREKSPISWELGFRLLLLKISVLLLTPCCVSCENKQNQSQRAEQPR